MKQKLSSLLTVTCCGILIAACNHAPSGPADGLTSGIVTSPAHPALTYYGLAKSGDSTYPAICVMDSDGRNQASVFVASSNGLNVAAPSWSPDGNSICFTQCGLGVFPDSIKVVDISAGQSMSPVLKNNVRTVVGLSMPGSISGLAGAGMTLGYAYWSSTSAFGMLAYTATIKDKISLCVVSAMGGTPKVLNTNWASERYGYIAWSPDDSRLAFCRLDPPYGNNTIMIFNTGDWSCVDSIKVSGLVEGIDWSRKGMNKLVFARAADFSSPYYLYYCDPKTGATPTTNGVVGEMPSWSPDNSSIVCYNNGASKVTSFTRLSTMVDPTIKSVIVWKR